MPDGLVRSAGSGCPQRRNYRVRLA